MILLSKQQIIGIHEQIVAATGGTQGLRDEGLLDAALAAPWQTFGGSELFPSLEEKAARLGYGLASNHPFLDGNKRIAAIATLESAEAQSSRGFLSKICSLTRSPMSSALTVGFPIPSSCWISRSWALIQ